MKEKLTPTEKSTGDMTTEPYSLPHNLEDALVLLENSDELREILGDRFVSAYVAIKRKEYRTYFQVISSWEREFLLLNV
jgi:glutamine synthetase